MEQELPQKNYSFPTKQTLSNDYLIDNFWKCLYTSSEVKLQYWVLLPINVKTTQINAVNIPELSLTNIGQYVRVDDTPYLEVQIAFEHCVFEMNASDWLYKKLAIMGEEIIHDRIIYGRSTGNYLDCLTKKKMNDGETVISRFTVLKDYDKDIGGANYVCIKVTCIEGDYEDLALKIFQIVSNWDLLNKSEWQMAEMLSPFMDDFAEPVKFFVPYSWEAKFNKNTNNNFVNYVFDHTVNGENKGIINSFFYKRTAFSNAEQLIDAQKKRFTIDDLKFTIHPIGVVQKNKITNPNISELYNAVGLLDLYEENFHAHLIIAVIATELGWYYFESIGPKPNLVNDYWEINKRCLQIMINSFNNLEFDFREDNSIV